MNEVEQNKPEKFVRRNWSETNLGFKLDYKILWEMLFDLKPEERDNDGRARRAEDSDFSPEYLAVRNQIAENYVGLVEALAHKVHRKLPRSVELGDLVSDGYFGLLDAVDKFDPERGFKFETYASTRIRGEITDKLRDFDWVSRHFRRRFTHLQHTRDSLMEELQREPSDLELSKRLGWPLEEIDRMQSGFNNSFHINIDERMKDSTHEFFKLSELIADESAPEAGYAIEHSELTERLLSALESLRPRESEVLFKYLYEDKIFPLIAEEMGMTVGRVSQIYDSALKALRSQLDLV